MFNINKLVVNHDEESEYKICEVCFEQSVFQGECLSCKHIQDENEAEFEGELDFSS